MLWLVKCDRLGHVGAKFGRRRLDCSGRGCRVPWKHAPPIEFSNLRIAVADDRVVAVILAPLSNTKTKLEQLHTE